MRDVFECVRMSLGGVVMLQSILILALMVAVFYLLYINGYMIINAKKASLFLGKERGKYARFASCSGYMKRVIRFKESREYEFSFETELEKGEVCVELWNGNQEKVLVLSNQGKQVISVDNKKRYFLILRFVSATGSYHVDWK